MHLRAFHSTLAGCALLFFASAASAGPKGGAPGLDQCLKAAEEGQAMRRKKRLVEAQTAFGLCAEESCPKVVRGDCGKWLAEVNAALPGLVVVARSAGGADIPKAEYALDDSARWRPVSGAAQPVDPGPHRVRVRAPGYGVKELDVRAVEGEQARRVAVALIPLAQQVNPASPRPGGKPGEGKPAKAGVSPWFWPAAALGVVGFGLAAGLTLDARGRASDLRSQCAPGCSEGEVDSLRSQLLMADLAFAAGALGTAGAIWMVLTPTNPGPRGQGFVMGVGGRFLGL